MESSGRRLRPRWRGTAETQGRRARCPSASPTPCDAQPITWKTKSNFVPCGLWYLSSISPRALRYAPVPPVIAISEPICLPDPAVIDLHCHILPGIDDGALDLPDSLAMARVAAADGIEVIAATPHIRHDHDVRIPKLAGRLEEMNRELRDAGIPVEVVTGGEVAETALDGLTAEELHAVSLGAGGWILLEPRTGPLSDSLLDSVDRLHEMGFHALIAHPERHVSGDMVEWIRKLIDLGALIQATAAFLVVGKAREGMLALARHGLIHVLASDAHSSHGGRPLRISQGIAALGEIEMLGPHLDWIAEEAPAAILRGEVPEPPFPTLS